MYGLISTAHVAVSAVLLQGVSLCTLVPKAPRYERWSRCHRSHLASPNTARDLHAAHVHTALGGDGTSHSASDSHHVCSSMDKRLQNCALCRCNGLNSTTGVTFITGATVRMCCTPYPPSLHHACRKLPTAYPPHIHRITTACPPHTHRISTA